MSEPIKTYLYVLYHPVIPDRFVGYTTQYEQMLTRWFDPDVKQPQYVEFMKSNGGLDSWKMKIVKICKSREEAECERSVMLFDPVYTMNKKGRLSDKPTGDKPMIGVLRKLGLLKWKKKNEVRSGDRSAQLH